MLVCNLTLLNSPYASLLPFTPLSPGDLPTEAVAAHCPFLVEFIVCSLLLAHTHPY
jgi:hypothetical protein